MSTTAKELNVDSRSALLIPPDQLNTRRHKLLVAVVAAFFNFAFSVFFRWKVTGQEYIPKTGPLFITPNHLSAFDLPTLGTVIVYAGWTPGVNMFTVAKQEVFLKRLGRMILPLAGLFPLYRNQADVTAIRTMLVILKRGGLLGIAPEGTRSPTGHLQLFQPVVAKIAIQKRVPILPVGLVGMENVMPIGTNFPRFVPIELHFGPMYELSEYYGKELTNEVLAEAAWKMRERVAALLPEWMRELPPEDAEIRFGAVRSKDNDNELKQE
jgi:1-acyl-sn-glycerol-3-phosphate acyltransferase